MTSPATRKLNSKWQITLEDWVCDILFKNEVHTMKIDAGFVHDWLSIPRQLKWYVAKECDKDDRHLAGLIHDFMYTYKCFNTEQGATHEVTRKEADDIFKQMLRRFRTPERDARLMHFAVATWGARNWGHGLSQVRYEDKNNYYKHLCNTYIGFGSIS